MSKKDSEKDDRFVEYLDDLLETDTAAIASMRRGSGMKPGECADMFRFIVPWIGEGTTRWAENVYYIVAGLYALHKIPSSDVDMNFGGSVAAITNDDNRPAMEKRFQILITSHQDDIHVYLRQIVQMMKEVDINWLRLIRDLKGWNNDAQYVQRAWAKSFWSLLTKETE